MEATVLFVLLEGFADWEMAYAASGLLTLGRGRYAVKTVSLGKEPIHSIGGLTVLPDYDIDSAPSNFTGLVLVGGTSWRKETARQVLPLVETAVCHSRLVGAICDAAAFLGTAGVLNSARHTANDLADLQAWAGTAYTGERLFVPRQVVRDANLVTANGTAALEFARELLLALQAAPEVEIRAWYTFHKLGCYDAPMPVM